MGKNLLSKYISHPVGSNYQGVLENFTGKGVCCGVSLINPEGLQLYLKETPRQEFSCKICDIFKNVYFEEHLRTASFTLNLILKTSTTYSV